MATVPAKVGTSARRCASIFSGMIRSPIPTGVLVSHVGLRRQRSNQSRVSGKTQGEKSGLFLSGSRSDLGPLAHDVVNCSGILNSWLVGHPRILRQEQRFTNANLPETKDRPLYRTDPFFFSLLTSFCSWMRCGVKIVPHGER
jgi:hypothetical protein